LYLQLSESVGCNPIVTNNIPQQNKQRTLIYKLSSGYEQTEHDSSTAQSPVRCAKLMSMEQEILTRIKEEINGDKETYLNNCRSNYLEYVSAAQLLFPQLYAKFVDGMLLNTLNQKVIYYKLNKDLENEVKQFEEAVLKGIPTPYTYERLVIIYS
jgi:hypothetical protein